MFKRARPFSNHCTDIFGRYRDTQAHHVLRRWQRRLSQPKLLTNAAFNGIAQHCGARIFLADHETEARAWQLRV